MPKLYYSVLTSYGSQAFARAMASRQPLNITTFAVGDGNGRAVQPDSSRTSLVREVYRANVSAISLDPRNARQVIFELTIPENVGGFWIREMGIFDNQNRLVAYANCPDSFKPQLESGSGKVQVLRMILLVSSSDAVTLTVDDSVIFAKRGELTPQTITATSQNGVDQTGHSHAIDHASTSRKGVVQLTNDTGLDSESLALTAKAGKKLAQEIAQNRLNTTNLANQKVDKTAISDSVSSTSQTTVASSKAVKTAYDEAQAKVPIEADIEIKGSKTFIKSIRIRTSEVGVEKDMLIGQSSVGAFIRNAYSNKFFVIANNNRLTYDDKPVFVKGLQNPHWDDVEGKPNASTSQRGVVILTDSVNFDSSDWGASAKALRTVNIKAEEARAVADNAMNRANAAHHSERSYVTTTANNHDFAGLDIVRRGNAGNWRSRVEALPDKSWKFWVEGSHEIFLPARGGITALEHETVRKSGDTMTGSLKSRHLGYGSWAGQYQSEAPFLVEAINSQDKNTFYPLVKGKMRGTGDWGSSFSFGFTSHQGEGDGFGRGTILFNGDNNLVRAWLFNPSGDFVSAGDVITGEGHSLNLMRRDYTNFVNGNDYIKRIGNPHNIQLSWQPSGLNLRVDQTDLGQFILKQHFSQNIDDFYGWEILPNGKMIQWGQATANGTGFFNAFPIAFRTKPVVLANHLGEELLPITIKPSPTYTGFSAKGRWRGDNIAIYYIAIGGV